MRSSREFRPKTQTGSRDKMFQEPPIKGEGRSDDGIAERVPPVGQPARRYRGRGKPRKRYE